MSNVDLVTDHTFWPPWTGEADACNRGECQRPRLEHADDLKRQRERDARQALAALDGFTDRATDPDRDAVSRARALKGGLREALAMLEQPHRVSGPAIRRLRQLADVDPEAPATAWDRALSGMERAGAKWTPEEVAAVDAAIATVAGRPRTFTADDVWTELGDGFLVTKGLAGRLNAAYHAGTIISTGRTRISGRTGQHGHGQRLTVWRRTLPTD